MFGLFNAYLLIVRTIFFGNKVAKKISSAQNAEKLAGKIKEISISEFFAKNRHLLGFDNPIKSLLTAVREGVDNALDACEEAHILPEIEIGIKEISEGRFLVFISDNGPGIVKGHLPNIFGKLLYGSKFHRLKQSRGQQGIGISAAVMYGQMTTGQAAEVISKTGQNQKTHKITLQIDTKKNAPFILKDEIIADEIWKKKASGTRISITLEGAYKEGKHGVLSYIKQTALANPHAEFVFYDPKEKVHVFKRILNQMPIEPKEIKPHPYGIELGNLIGFLQEAKKKTLLDFFTSQFSRVSEDTAKAICKNAKLDPNMKASLAGRTEAEKLFKAIKETKLLGPPTNCLSPLGEDAILKSLYYFFVDNKNSNTTDNQGEFNFDKKPIKEDAILSEEEGFFVTAVSRNPSIYRGNPFQIEVGLFYGKSLPHEEPVQVFRFANRVPLQYQMSACAMTKAIVSTPWKSYGLMQSKGALPMGPVVILVSISSVWVPYTSESKEAVAHYPEIIKELKLALMEGGRRLSKFINKRKRHFDEAKKREYIEKYLSPIEEALKDILGNKISKGDIGQNLRTILEKSRSHKEVKMDKKIIHSAE